MPSPHQPAARWTSYADEPTRMLATKNDMTLSALIRGMRDPDRALAYIEAEIDLADREDRKPRSDLIAMLNRTLDDLRE